MACLAWLTRSLPEYAQDRTYLAEILQYYELFRSYRITMKMP
ncbi:MAG: hypothetical protein RMJ66_06200 [Bacteroidia bacterium]|nr:hypothetical protein [Bacteroidia bacterium]MDW8134643.1 hypothetical protein [Bacteroidia bacterium]